MQDDQIIPVLTGDHSGMEDYWHCVSSLIDGAECVVSPDGVDARFSAMPVAIVDLSNDLDGCLLNHAAETRAGIPNRADTLLYLAHPKTRFDISLLPDAILTAPCPADVVAGTVNQLRRLITREQELQIRKDALRSIGLADPTDKRCLDADRPSVLVIGQKTEDRPADLTAIDTVTCVAAPTLSAAQSYMNWHNFRLAIAYLNTRLDGPDIQNVQAVLKGIPLIVSMVEPDRQRQLELYDQGALDVVAGPTDAAALEMRTLVAARYYQRVSRSKDGLAQTKSILSDLPVDIKKAFAETYRALLADRVSAPSAMRSFSIEAYEPAVAAMTQDLSDRAVDGIRTVLEIATRDEDLSLFLGDDQVLTILAGTDNAGAAVALRRIAAILKSTDLPAIQDGQKIRVNLRSTTGT